MRLNDHASKDARCGQSHETESPLRRRLQLFDPQRISSPASSRVAGHVSPSPCRGTAMHRTRRANRTFDDSGVDTLRWPAASWPPGSPTRDNDDEAAVGFYRRALTLRARQSRRRAAADDLAARSRRLRRRRAIAEELKRRSAVDRITADRRAAADAVDAVKRKSGQGRARLLDDRRTNELDRLMDELAERLGEFGRAKPQGRDRDARSAERAGLVRRHSATTRRPDRRCGRPGARRRRQLTRPRPRTKWPPRSLPKPSCARSGAAPARYRRASRSRATSSKRGLDLVPQPRRRSAPLERGDRRRQAACSRDHHRRAGAAEVLFTSARALNREGAEDFVSLYLQLARGARPGKPTRSPCCSAALPRARQASETRQSSIYDDDRRRTRRCAGCRPAERPRTSTELDKVEEARTQLRELIDQDPDDIRGYLALGSVFPTPRTTGDGATSTTRRWRRLGTQPQSYHWNLLLPARHRL